MASTFLETDAVETDSPATGWVGATSSTYLFEYEAGDTLLASVQSSADRLEAAEIQLLDTLADVVDGEAFRADGASSLTAWLRRRLSLDVPTARRFAHTARVLLLLPGLRSALTNGSTSLSHVRLLERVATQPRHDHLHKFAEQLVGYACTLGLDDYRTVCEHWADLVDNDVCPTELPAGHLRFSPTLFGQADVVGRLSADQAAVVGEALALLNRPDPADAPVKRTNAQRNADALADLAHHYLNGTSLNGTGSQDEPASASSRSRNRAAVVIDLDTLTRHLPELWDDDRLQPALDTIRRHNQLGQPLPADIAELLMCDASIQRLLTGPGGSPLDLGRSTPVVSAAQRTALAHRDRGCDFPTCTRPAHHCDAHHLRHWSRGGRTNLDNLVLLCRHHHRLVHGPTWTIERDAVTGLVTATRREPDTNRVVVYQRDGTGTATKT